jgi:hypothetical protein
MLFTNFIGYSAPTKHALCVLLVVAALAPRVLQGQVIIHEVTPEGDIIRARADAALLYKQAELVGEKANAQRLNNMLKECDVAYKQMETRKKTKGTLETKFERTFDVIRFNQQLADIRSALEHKATMQRTRVGDPTEEMNSLLEKFARQSIDASRYLAMKTELSPEQLDAIFLTDGSNTFSGKTGKTKLEAFKWPFLIKGKDFKDERDQFERQCEKAIEEINTNGSVTPETIVDLLKKAEAIGKKLDSLPMSDSASIRSVETKWRKEAKAFLSELSKTLGICSKLDSEKLSKYVFQGKTLGELIEHLNAKGLRFSHPGEQDANLYASVFFLMRYAYQECEKGPIEKPNASGVKPSSTETKKVTIQANKPWPVSVQVKKGQTVHITASGHWLRMAGGKKRGPGDKELYLQGRLGDGKPFRIGADYQLVIDADSVLYLGVLDTSEYSNNTGQLHAVLTVTKGPNWEH